MFNDSKGNSNTINYLKPTFRTDGIQTQCDRAGEDREGKPRAA